MKKKTIYQIVAEAEKLGMSYGQYVSMLYEKERKRRNEKQR